MNISKQKFIYNLSFLLFWSAILTLPLSLLFKIDLGVMKFSVSYVFLVTFSFVAIINYLFFFKKFSFQFFRKKVILLILLSVLIYFFNSFHTGIDIKYYVFLLTFFMSIIIGYQYSELMQKFFNEQFVLLAYFLAIAGLVLYYFNIPLFDFEYAGGENYFKNSYGFYRLSSIVLNPNSFAYMLLLYFSFFLYSKKNVINSVAMLFVLIAFILTESRSALIGLILMFIIYSHQYIKQKVILFKISIGILLLLLLLLLLLFTNESVLINYDIRFTKLSIAIDYIFSSFEYFLLGVPSNVKVEKSGISFSDNMFLFLILKMGFLSFILFTFGYFYSISKTSKILFKTNNVEIKPYALFLTATIPPMFFSDLLLFSPVHILVGLSIGVLEKGCECEKVKRFSWEESAIKYKCSGETK